MKKRLISLLLAAVMLFSMFPATAFAAQEPVENPFTDVEEGSWYYDAIMYVYANGLFNGVSKTTFEPDGSMTRGMFVTVLGRMAGVDPDDYRGDTGFTDVAKHQWYAPYVKWAAEVGVTKGTDPGCFSPNMTLSRQHLATFFVRYFELFDVDYDTGINIPTQPEDLDKVADWAADSVMKLWAKGLLNGDGVEFRPADPATRAEASMLCMQAGLKADNDSDDAGDDADGGNQSAPDSGRKVAVVFYDGDRMIETLYATQGKPLGAVPDPKVSSKKGHILVGYYQDPDFTTPFYAEEPVENACRVYARYEEMGSTEVLNLSVFTQMDVTDTGLSFIITRIPGALGNVSPKNAAVAEVKDGTAPVNVTITDLGNDRYEVAPDGAWNEGSSYELHLADGWMFEGKADTIRTASFSIHREEVENLQMSDKITYIRDTESLYYTIRGGVHPVLTPSLLEGENITGTFNYPGLNRDDILCIYVGKHPVTERSEDADYLDPAVYVRVQSVSGNVVTFAPLTAEDQQELYEVPDNFPILVDALPTADGAVDFEDALDHAMYQAMIGLANPDLDAAVEQRADTVERALEVLNVGDFLTFYVDDADGITDESDLAYGRITDIAADGTVTYIIVTRQQLLECMDLYADMAVSGDQLVTPEMKAQIEAAALAQIEADQFAEDAAWFLADLVTKTDSFRNNMNVQAYLLADGDDDGSVKMNNISVIPRLITSGNRLHFGDGVQLSITVDAEFEVECEDGSIMFDVSAEFIQEVALSPFASGNLIYKEILFIPIPVGVHIGAGIDVKSYTAVGFDAEIYTVAAEDEPFWDRLKSFTQNPEEIVGAAGLPSELVGTIQSVGELMDEIDRVTAIIEQNKENIAVAGEYRRTLSKLWNVMSENGLSSLDYSKILRELDRTNVSQNLLDMMETGETYGESYAEDLQALLDRYNEIVTKETDWIKLVEEEIFSTEVCYFGLCIGVEVSFVVRADMSLAIGTNLEYEVGKRYSFWFEIGLFEPTAGSSTMDLIDEQFAFQFYVMGRMGIKAGIKAKIYAGIGSGKLASVGIAAEIGPYIKLYGFYVYEYTRYRAANTKDWISNERMEGAMYLEFGLYFILSFEAEALGLFEYSYDFLDEEIPLLEAGRRRYYYGFNYEPTLDEHVVIYGQTRLDKTIMMLDYMDLVTGLTGCDVSTYESYNFTLSNPNFKLWYDEDWGVPVIDVEVPDNVRIMECDLTITYKGAKMPFSNVDMTVTVPLMWTNLTGREMREYYTASVAVGNAIDGYTTVWTKKVLKGQTFSLPTAAEVKAMLGWDDNKYIMGAGYGSQELTGLTITDHTAFRFDVQHQVYSVTVEGIQKEDGSITSKTYYAKYGETFDFSDLLTTGTRNPATETWTRFKEITTDCTVAQRAVRGGEIVYEQVPIDLTVPVNAVMAEALGGGITAQAQYQDNSVGVVFSFNGIPHEDVIYRVEKGGTITADQYAALEAIVEQAAMDEFGMTMGIASVSPEWRLPLYNATNFIVNCSAFSGTRSTISFVDNYGVEGTPENPTYSVADITKMEGAYIGPLYPISRRGYEFLGWYVADPADVHVEANGVEWVDSDLLTEEFTAQKMPEHDVRLYAKWKPLEFLVTFDEGHYGQELTDGADKMVVVYDSTYEEGYVYDAEAGQRTNTYYVDAYGSLPVPEELITSGLDQRFVFWYYLDEDLYTWLNPHDRTYYSYFRYYGSDQYGDMGDWVRIDEDFDPQVKVIENTTLRSYWKDKVTVPVASLFKFSSKTVTYERYTNYTMDYTYAGGTVMLDVINGQQKTVSAYPTGDATGIFFEEIAYPASSSFEIGYRQDGVAQDDYFDSCHNAGTYHVNVERAEDRVFKSAKRFFSTGSDPKLVIGKATRTANNGSLGTASIYASNAGYSSAELGITNSSALDIHENATLCFAVDGSDCFGCQGFIHSLDPGTTYSGNIKVKISGDPNYYDAEMPCSGSFRTLSAPTLSWSSVADTSWYDSSKTEFEIRTAEQLAGLAVLTDSSNTTNDMADATIRLMADIDLSGREWEPIGWFDGVFDGNDHMITGLYCSNESTLGVIKSSFIYWIGDGAVVKNLVIGDGYIRDNAGGASGIVSVVRMGTVKQCVSYATVVSERYSSDQDADIGGIVGTLQSGRVANCVNYGKVTSNAAHVGGIVGYANTKTGINYVVNCANYGTVMGSSRVGGICGVNDNELTNYIYNCINIGNVVGEGVFTGAIIGRNHKDHGVIVHNYYRENSCYSGEYGNVGAVGKDEKPGYIDESEAKGRYNNCSFNSNLKLARDCGYGTALITALDRAKEDKYADHGALAWIRSGPGSYPIPMQTKRREDFK